MIDLDNGSGAPAGDSDNLDAPVSQQERVLSFRLKRSGNPRSAASRALAKAGVGIETESVENSVSDPPSISGRNGASATAILDPTFFKDASLADPAVSGNLTRDNSHQSLKQSHDAALSAMRQKVQARRDARSGGTGVYPSASQVGVKVRVSAPVCFRVVVSCFPLCFFESGLSFLRVIDLDSLDVQAGYSKTMSRPSSGGKSTTSRDQTPQQTPPMAPQPDPNNLSSTLQGATAMANSSGTWSAC